MANWDKGEDIYSAVMARCGDADKKDADKIKRMIQRAYWDFIKLKPWPFALKDTSGLISLLAEETGTATCTNGSTATTLSDSITASMAGRKIMIDNENVIYRISAHTADTSSATLDIAYTEDTVTGGAFTIFQDEYSLAADCMRPWRFWPRNNPDEEIDFIGLSESYQLYPDETESFSDNISNMKIAMIREDKIRVINWTETAKTIEYDYTYRPTALTFDGAAANDTPNLPQDDRWILEEMALFYLKIDAENESAGNLPPIIADKIASMSDFYLGATRPRKGLQFTVRRR